MVQNIRPWLSFISSFAAKCKWSHCSVQRNAAASVRGRKDATRVWNIEMSLVFFRPLIWVGDSFGFCLATTQLPSMLRRAFLHVCPRDTSLVSGARRHLLFGRQRRNFYARFYTIQERNHRVTWNHRMSSLRYRFFGRLLAINICNQQQYRDIYIYFTDF